MYFYVINASLIFFFNYLEFFCDSKVETNRETFRSLVLLYFFGKFKESRREKKRDTLERKKKRKEEFSDAGMSNSLQWLFFAFFRTAPESRLDSMFSLVPCSLPSMIVPVYLCSFISNIHVLRTVIVFLRDVEPTAVCTS